MNANNGNTDNEERDPGEALASRTAYVILALLLVAVLTVTIVAIAATVSKRNDAPPPEGDLADGATDGTTDGSGGDPSGDEPSGGAAGGDEQPSTDGNGDPAPGESTDKGDDSPTVEPQVFVRPCSGYILKAYSSSVLSASTTMNDYRTHGGVDIASELGASVYALSDGVITEVTYAPMMGQTVVITHPGGIVSKYMNLSSELPEGVSVGAEVSAGDLIGAVGETALIECAEPPHLHLEVYLNGDSIDPTEYVSLEGDVSASTDHEDGSR